MRRTASPEDSDDAEDQTGDVPADEITTDDPPSVRVGLTALRVGRGRSPTISASALVAMTIAIVAQTMPKHEARAEHQDRRPSGDRMPPPPPAGCTACSRAVAAVGRSPAPGTESRPGRRAAGAAAVVVVLPSLEAVRPTSRDRTLVEPGRSISRGLGCPPPRPSRWRLGALRRNMRFTVRASVVPSATQPTQARSRARLRGSGTRCTHPHADLPAPSGLYDPRFEHDACGVSFVANIKGVAQPRARASWASARCATSSTAAPPAPRPTPATAPASSSRSPTASSREVAGVRAAGRRAPTPSGMAFLPADPVDAEKAHGGDRERSSPTRAWPCSAGATCRSTRRASAPAPRAVMPSVPPAVRRRSRRRRRHRPRPQGVRRPQAHRARAATRSSRPTSRRCRRAPSSTRGCSPRRSWREFFPDLGDERVESALALVHSRFSTNTFPSWPLAHPYRFIAHNGEINTVQGNRNWMRAREALLASPTCCPGSSGRSRSARPAAATRPRFDEVLELLHLGGRSLPHAVLMMIPEAWENHDHDGRRRSGRSTASTPR